MKKIFCILFIAAIAIKANAQFPRVNIPGSELRTINSAIVTGQQYELHILLPGEYKNSNKKYPVVYLMDSQWDFPLLKSIYGQQYFDGFIPELIIVGITWGGTNPNADSLRVRDYTPTNNAGQKQSGGADKFLSFMRNELFPFIESNYKADDKNRTIMGCSLGGLITMYALFSQPDMFSGYAAASPAIGWDNEVIYKYEKKYFESISSYPARLYITMGGVERNVPGFEKLLKYLSARTYSFLKLKQVVLENTGHSGTKSETYGRGLQYIFEKPTVKLEKAVLEKYTGTYESASGTIEIKVENERLVLYFSATNKYELYAASNSEFYSNAEFLNIHFSSGLEFELQQYGRHQSFKKKK